MATEDLKSTLITQQESLPLSLVSTIENKGEVRVSIGHVSATTGMLTGSSYRLVRLPSNARIVGESNVQFATALDCTDVDVGIRHVTLPSTDDAYGDDDAFVTAFDTTAAATQVDLFAIGDSSTKRTKMLWEYTSATQDPGGEYDVVVTNDATVDVGGEMVAEIYWVQ